MSAQPQLASDAAIALGIASTAMPFARTPADEAERWLRVLRLDGQVGQALQALGVSEEPLSTDDANDEQAPARAAGTAAQGDAVRLVTERAVSIAAGRHAPALATTDLLMAVIDVYGEEFERVLRVHGTDRRELFERLGLAGPDAGAAGEPGHGAAGEP
ncbi:MAG TPA: hypothetical protein VL979_07395 [Solirubrobacteraceae bacterium]|nr:hypothetical protein [Solirubrobacteraceae bacterium]